MSKIPVKLLHVEDEASQHKVLMLRLRSAAEYQFEPTWVTGEDEALTAYQAGQFDLVIMDYMLEQGNGLHLLQTLRSFDPVVPVIAISGVAPSAVALDLIKAGADDYFDKSNLDTRKLVTSIRESLDRAVKLKRQRSSSVDFEARFDDFVHDVADRLGPDFPDRFEQLTALARRHREAGGIGAEFDPHSRTGLVERIIRLALRDHLSEHPCESAPFRSSRVDIMADRTGFDRNLIAIAAIWVLLIVAGFGSWHAYDAKPGPVGPVRADRVAKVDGPSIDLFLHPHCACSRWALPGFLEAVERRAIAATITIHFVIPSDQADGWEQSRSWDLANSVPGIACRIDRGGAIAASLGAETSGFMVIRNGDGRIAFRGGISGPDRRGESIGLAAIRNTLNGQQPPQDVAPVFGCPLFNRTHHVELTASSP